MFDEVERASWSKHPEHFSKCLVDSRDRTEGPGAKDGIDAASLERELLCVSTDEFDGHGALCQAPRCESTSGDGWIDCTDATDRRRVVRNVEPGPESDLENLAGKSSCHSLSDRGKQFSAEHRVHEAREEAVAVPAHGAILAEIWPVRCVSGQGAPSPTRSPKVFSCRGGEPSALRAPRPAPRDRRFPVRPLRRGGRCRGSPSPRSGPAHDASRF